MKLHWGMLRVLLPGQGKGTGPGGRYATFNQRMWASTIDSLLAFFILNPPMDYLLQRYYPAKEIDWSAASRLVPPNATPAEGNMAIVRYLVDAGHVSHWANILAMQFWTLALVIAVCWHFWAATPGKMLLRMKILDAKTEKPISDIQIILRLFGYILAAIPCGLGYFWIGISKRKRGWHDYFAETVVVIIPPKPVTPMSEAVAPSDSPAPSKAE